jgi:hypothetical protein
MHMKLKRTLNELIVKLDQVYVVINGWFNVIRIIVFVFQFISLIMTNIVPFPESAQNETLSEEGQEGVQEEPMKVPHRPAGRREEDGQDGKEGSVEADDGNVVRRLED